MNGRTGQLARRVRMVELLDLVDLEPGWSMREYADRLGTTWSNLDRLVRRNGYRAADFERRPGVHGPTWCTQCSHCSPMIGLDVRDHGHGKSRTDRKGRAA